MDAEKAHEHAKAMLIKKTLDAVCLNIITEENSFGSDQNHIDFITKEKTISLPLSNKESIARTIVELSAAL